MATPRASQNNARHHGSAPRRRPPKKKVNPNRPGLKPPKRAPVLTTAQWADREASRIVEAQLAAIRGQENAWRSSLQAEAAARAQQAQNFARMVQGMGIDKNIQGIYQGAGHDVAGYGAGFSGEVRQLADADAAETINLLGGSSEGVRNQGDAMGNVLHGIGGFIPSAELAAQGAAFASDAAAQPGFMLQQGLMEAERGLHEGMSQNPFLDAILETKMSKHDISTSLREEKIGMNLKAQEMRLDQMEADRKYWLAMQAMYLDQKKYKLAAQAEKRARQAQNRYDQEARGMTPDGEVAPGFYRDPKSGRIIQNGYRPDGTRISTASKSGKDKRGGSLTVNEQQRQLEKVYAAEDDIKKLATDLAHEFGWNPTAGSTRDRGGPLDKKSAQATRNRIAARIRQQYGWVTTTRGKRALSTIIGRVLNSLSRIGPPAPGSDAGSSGSGLFD